VTCFQIIHLWIILPLATITTVGRDKEIMLLFFTALAITRYGVGWVEAKRMDRIEGT
jgi:hypothetical protein